MNVSAGPVWLITGGAAGLGRALATHVIGMGHRVVVTDRERDHVAHFSVAEKRDVIAMGLDLGRVDRIDPAIMTAIEQFGGIDFLVVNTDPPYTRGIEEGDMRGIREHFESAVFGVFAITRAVLPALRRRGGGHIFLASAVSGWTDFSGGGYYSASKRAIEGWSDALRAEVAEWGIGVTCLETDTFLTDSDDARHPQEMVAEPREIVSKRPVREGKGALPTQRLDPSRIAEVVERLAGKPAAPHHLAFGRAAFDHVMERMSARLLEIARHRESSLAGDLRDPS